MELDLQIFDQKVGKLGRMVDQIENIITENARVIENLLRINGIDFLVNRREWKCVRHDFA